MADCKLKYKLLQRGGEGKRTAQKGDNGIERKTRIGKENISSIRNQKVSAVGEENKTTVQE